ncbi:30S ribosomal protein S8 [bacterium E08(2017)]|nr:30S ribosomal protein S8 [bacterium E08(2017)]
MSYTDPISDMLTRIRNAQAAEHESVELPHSRIKEDIAKVLKREGYIRDYVVDNKDHKVLRVYLKYLHEMEPMIKGIQRESKPGLRKYAPASDLPKVLGGLGIAIMSTSSGIMTGKEARQQNIGGEILCSVW